MLSTNELKNYVYSEINNKLNNVEFNNLYFSEGSDSSIEGTYIFNKNNVYHILFTEKGKVRKDILTDNVRDVLWYALEVVATNIIMDYAIQNRENNKDFRRALFIKEKEIYALFGNEFKKKKEKEIEDILKRNPYIDEQR